MAEHEEMSRENGNQDEDITMVDFLKEEEKLEADAKAVLGGSDAKNCTYPKGYLSRQALYACYTCTPDPDKPAGVCLACSYDCHEGHELFELYTKRDFRCDCGNKKFPNRCKLFNEKVDVNDCNKYNHNFSGKYCTCSRPYPDPEDDVDDEMFQCVICEDWFHERHLNVKLPEREVSAEIVCGSCMKTCSFLWTYHVANMAVKLEKREENTVVDVGGVECQKEKSSSLSSSSTSTTPFTTISAPSTTSSAPSTTSSAPSTTSSAPSTTTSTPSTTTTPSAPSSSSSDGCADGVKEEKDDVKIKEETTERKVEEDQGEKPNSSDEILIKKDCLYQELQKGSDTGKDHSTYWSEGWRSTLCTCQSCLDMYKSCNVSFLTDEKDLISVYEAKGQGFSSDAPTGLEALSKMNRIQQIEVIHGYNDLKSELTDYLKKFADSKKVVREEDIREFFTGLEARKRQRTSAVPTHFCR